VEFLRVNLNEKNLSNLKFVDFDFSFAKIEMDLSDSEFLQCDLFYASGIFLGKAKSVAKCFIKGNKTQLTFAVDQFDLENKFGSGSVADISLEENVELPNHWMHEGTPYETLREAWRLWLQEQTGWYALYIK
jgi:hypothetical protein